ncbi:SDR family oxidoreductase [Fonticella tunisiensis]|uniref:NADP-dependent 3-hydroxy acid dehydrogenase YdfG n=1 Tax=Fonticella tunisiensis TaxID=1096341 RepID=A0A4R7KAN1_9CLOT|nr:SDR family oxidoreductase [Fonticella tunisiensis]TDT50464.1 NADP-dependent 3-hydroxy acid dehydrogenase YdfG [Fonticella tunisiensis]
MRLEGKVAIITGASRGIGEAIALTFAKERAKIVIASRNDNDLKAVENELELLGSEYLAIPTDVTKEDDVNRLITETKNKFGKIDILVNNAGIGLFKPILDITLNEWNEVMNVNATGTFLCTKAVLPVMLHHGSGWIVNICSDASRRTFVNGSLYCASKHAQYAFSEAVNREVQKKGIHVGSILPGNVDTCFNGSVQGAEDKQWMIKAQDIANAALFMVTQPDNIVINEIVVHPVMQNY